MIISDAASDDVLSICEIEDEAFNIPWTREQIASAVFRKNSVFLTAKKNDVIAGYINMDYVEDEGYIGNIAVAGEYRRQGIAAGLLAELCLRAVRLRLRFITLEARAGNLPAISLYKKYGFRELGVRRNYYYNPTENALILTKYIITENNI